MSGICGIVRFDGKEVLKEDIQKMLDAMQNRGKDEENIVIKNNVGFGHKQLWTTQESTFEFQPLILDNLIITADARMDNRDKLFEQLGIDQNTSDNVTDIDLILWSYQKWGEECSKYFIGDFAFSIWDTERQQLFAARDYMGIKPYFYCLDQAMFVFASEVAPINEILNEKKKINLLELKTFYKFGSIGCEQTFYEEIYRLKAFHYLLLKDNQVNITRFWFPETIKINYKLSLEEAKSRFRDIFLCSVRSKLRSITPVASELSGGLDSSSVTAVAAHLSEKNNVRPFSQYFGDMLCDEKDYSEAVVKKYGMDPLYINADKLDYGKLGSIDNWNSLNPEYPGRGNFVSNIYELELLKKNKIRVLLTGHGGDHLMTGNGLSFKDYFFSAQFKAMREELKDNRYSPKFLARQLLWMLPSMVRKFIRKVMHKTIEPFYQTICADNFFLKNDTYQFYEINAYAGIHYQFWIDYNPNKVAGRYDIEVRHPFFDKRLFEFMLTVPNFYKKKGKITKYLLKEAMKDFLPDKIYHRNDKVEFSEIVAQQYMSLEQGGITFNNVIKYGLTSADEIEELLKVFKEKKWYSTTQFDVIWELYLIDKWLEKVVNL